VSTVPIVIIGLIVVFVLLLVRGAVRIVLEYQRLVVFRLGKLRESREPGLRFLIPFLEKGIVVDLREFFLEIPRQDSITKDNAAISIDFIM
jgi:regulator of protease activity HflC (stomatin/prohibitin superfamily)